MAPGTGDTDVSPEELTFQKERRILNTHMN